MVNYSRYVLAGVTALAGVLGPACSLIPTEPNEDPLPLQSNRLALAGLEYCLIEPSGEVICWGRGEPSRVTPGDGSLRFVALRAGSDHFCGLTADSTAYCWGGNRDGQLGDGTVQDRELPTPVASEAKFVAIATSGRTSCGLDQHGRLLCWGRHDYGTLQSSPGSGGPIVTVPIPVRTAQRFRSLGGGFASACGLTRAGEVFCWVMEALLWTHGYSAPGDCDNTFYYRYQGTPCMVPVPLAESPRFESLGGSACALTGAGEAFCWGDGDLGKLGNGAESGYSIPPVQVVGGIRFKLLSGTCGLDLEGRAYCWGNNWNGALGIGETGSLGNPSFRAHPVPVLTDERFVTLARGGGHTCALTADERLWCWGLPAFADRPVQISLPVF